MFELRADLSLQDEATHRVRIALEAVAQSLQGDDPAEPAVVGDEYAAHASLAEQLAHMKASRQVVRHCLFA